MSSNEIFKTGDVYKLNHKGVWATFLLNDELMSSLEGEAVSQLRGVMEMPGVDRVYLSPDMHVGFGFPIGTTLYSKTHIYPDVVGPDPACSVALSYVDYDLTDTDKPTKRHLLNKVENRVAIERLDTGFTMKEFMSVLRGENRPEKAWITHDPLDGDDPVFPLIEQLTNERMLKHRSTIGGGNHFLEFGESSNGHTYILSHFGSRGLGAAGARYFEERLMNEMNAWGLNVNKRSLKWMPADSEIGRLYMSFQRAMLEFSAYNHHYIHMKMEEVFDSKVTFQGHIPHNFIEERNGYFVGRKGATPAYDYNGLPLLIPGSMSTGSYVLSPGPEAHRLGETVAHGAGRVLGRRAAKEALVQEDVDREFNEAGLMGNFRNVPIDESAGAYKDIEAVIASLVDTGAAVVQDRLNPQLVVKG